MGGSDAQLEDWPWHGSLFYQNEESKDFKCGVSLIDERYALTAAHCVMNQNTGIKVDANILLVEFGFVELLGASRYRQSQTVDRIIVHPDYKSDSTKHDIALLLFRTTVVFSNYVLPICLPENHPKRSIDDIENKNGSVVGHGTTQSSSISNNLQKAEIPVVSHVDCIQHNPALMGPTIHYGMFCAGSLDGTTLCAGDSGGGMYFRVGKQWILRGIASFAGQGEPDTNGCDVKNYVAFVNVRYYMNWISEQMDGGRQTKDQNYVGGDQRVSHMEYEQMGIAMTESAIPHPLVDDEPLLHQASDCRVPSDSTTEAGESSATMVSPWIARIQHIKLRNNEKRFHCEGSLINRRYVLTAATCISGIPSSWNVTAVRLGEWDTNAEMSCKVRECAVQDIGIEKTIVHENFTNEYIGAHNDIALLRLASKVEYSRTIKPICLPLDSSFANRPFDGAKLMVTRWIKPEADSKSRYKMHLTIPKVSMRQCRRLWSPIQINNQQVCAGGVAGTDICSGNIGAPLMELVSSTGQKSQPTIYMVGLESFGRKCEVEKVPEVYTKINRYVDWILNHIEP